MKRLRTYSSIVLLLLFSCYYCSISMFQHTHIANGSSIVHSHMGGSSEHDHTQEQVAVIDILSTFQSESAPTPFSIDSPCILLEASRTFYLQMPHLTGACDVHALRGPPQA